jgi:hypothetical protein
MLLPNESAIPPDRPTGAVNMNAFNLQMVFEKVGMDAGSLKFIGGHSVSWYAPDGTWGNVKNWNGAVTRYNPKTGKHDTLPQMP